MSADLWQGVQDTLRDLDRVNATALKFGRDKVLAEAAYYGAKARAAFELKERGMPVSYIEMVVKGQPEVAKALTAYHMAEIEYDNARECVMTLKKKLTVLNDQIQREWSQSGMRSV